MLGAPGSGKGTRANVLCGLLKIPQISTGDIFRENLKNNTELGKIAKGYMESGGLVPDEITVAMVAERLEKDDVKNGFILDGFPRTVKQAEELEKMLGQKGEKLTSVIFINVSDDVIMERLSGRRICGKCQAPYHTSFSPPKNAETCDKCGEPLTVREDDKPETVKKRLEVFASTTLPLVEFYKLRGLLIDLPSTELEEDMGFLRQKLGVK